MTARPNLVPGIFSSAAFRLSAAILAAFVALAAIVALALFQQTNSVLSEQVVATLRDEAATLSREAEMGGLAGLTEAVRARSRPEGPGLYYLGDESWRNATSFFHLWLGLAAPGLLIWHIRQGRAATRE